MTKTYELPNERMIMADVDEKHHTATVSVYALDELVAEVNKTGHWIAIDEEPHEVWECDHCGFVIDSSGCIEPYEYRDTYKYCPNCGAKMESEG